MSEYGPLHLPASPHSIPHFAVAFKRHGRRRIFSHSAIFFRSLGGMVRCLDLRLDGNAACEDLPVAEECGYAWAIPNLDNLILKPLAWFCERLSADPHNLGYWLEYDEDDCLIDDGASITTDDDTVGFTCSTFVLAVLASQGIALLALGDWEHRPAERVDEDDRIQGDILEMLRNQESVYGLSPELAAREDRIPCLRYSPEDVIGATRIGTYPVAFADAWPSGIEARNWVDQTNAWRGQ